MVRIFFRPNGPRVESVIRSRLKADERPGRTVLLSEQEDWAHEKREGGAPDRQSSLGRPPHAFAPSCTVPLPASQPS